MIHFTCCLHELHSKVALTLLFKLYGEQLHRLYLAKRNHTLLLNELQRHSPPWVLQGVKFTPQISALSQQTCAHSADIRLFTITTENPFFPAAPLGGCNI